jgi:hypothetical protein
MTQSGALATIFWWMIDYRVALASCRCFRAAASGRLFTCANELSTQCNILSIMAPGMTWEMEEIPQVTFAHQALPHRRQPQRAVVLRDWQDTLSERADGRMITQIIARVKQNGPADPTSTGYEITHSGRPKSHH